MTHPHPAETSIRSEEQAYDATPYASHPHGQTQPARLAAIAHLSGLNPPDVETARVLELGCASGGNLIPLAVHFPRAQFVGVDISGKQVAEGRRLLERLNLQNIELRHAGIESITAAEGRFDYIICHGIYSWVPEPVRDALLRVCGENLSDTGVAFVSYNTLPGWHLVQPVRDLMMYWTGDIADPEDKARVALEVLDSMKDIAEEFAGSIYRKEADILKRTHASYVMHDHLEQVNAPCYLKDFVAHAERHALAYLDDIGSTFFNPLNRTPLQVARIDKYAGGDIVRAEQYMDFLDHRRFRQTLLVKQAQKPGIDRTSPLARLDGLHFRLVRDLVKDPAPSARMQATWWHAGAETYRTPSGAVTARSQAASRVLAWLAGHAGDSATFTLADLLRHAAPANAMHVRGDADKRQLAELIWELMGMGALRAYICRIAAPLPAAETPAVSPLARAAAALGHATTSNMFHDHVQIADNARTLLGLLDGMRTPAQLAEMMGPDFAEEDIRQGLHQLEATLVLR